MLPLSEGLDVVALQPESKSRIAEMEMEIRSLGSVKEEIEATPLKAPFPWFGGKSKVARLVWQRFGNVPNYVEPFAGSLAVLLGRESAPRVETVNDIDCWISNFWRALQNDPEGVATHADWPVNEADLHARHLWLVNQSEFRERMKTDPDYFDVKIAGWWCWGICQWIGSGWCAQPGWRGRTNAGRAARGIHQEDVWRVRPTSKRTRLGRGQGRGVSRQIPQLKGYATSPGTGVLSEQNTGLIEWLCDLGERLRRVRVCCGDWNRVLGPSVTHKIALAGVFLDPPYDMRVVSDKSETGRDGAAPSDKLYEHHDNEISAAVREWAIQNGDNPLLRIAVCGYEGEHDFPSTWHKVAWKANGGFGNQNPNTKRSDKRTRERIWFSPHCLNGKTLFDGLVFV